MAAVEVIQLGREGMRVESREKQGKGQSGDAK